MLSRNTLALGGQMVVEMKSVGGRLNMLSPALMDVTPMKEKPDVELFGPFLQLTRVASFDAAIAEANRTRYGLSAGLLSDNPDLWSLFYRRIRAGVVTWNRQTTNSSSYLPFGGTGLSGNHRPSGYFAADYCAQPVAVMHAPSLPAAPAAPMGFESTAAR